MMPEPTPDQNTTRQRIGHGLAAILLLGGLHVLAPTVGIGWSWVVTAVLLAGALARQNLRVDPYRVMMLTGLVVLALWQPRFAAYEIALVTGLWAVRHRPRLFFALLIGGGMVLPKTLRFTHIPQPIYWDWINQMSLGHVLVISALWWIERRRGRVADAPLPQWLTFFAGPTNALNPINFGPLDMWRPPASGASLAAKTLLLIGIKGATLWIIDTRGAHLLLPQHSFETLSAMALPQLWLVVGLNYLRLLLYLSGTADVAVMILRVFGWPLAHPYRWALLAWNPVELWRRWSIYNRKLLLKLIYFPLGGGHKRRYFNVMMTFLGSAVLLHSGWFGSYYWTLGLAGLRDQTVYFTLQGLAVCACLALWQWRGKDPGSDRGLRLSGWRAVGTVATQAYSALVHLVILAPHVEWEQRWRLMGRCLGFE